MIFMALLSMVIFFSVRSLMANASPFLLDSSAVVLVLLVGVYVRLVWGQLWIVRWIPFSSVIVLSNWFPLILGALAGVLWVRTKSQTFLRRLPTQLLLIAGAVWSVAYVIPRTPPACGTSWIEPTVFVPFRICRQTTPYTCSAAATATIQASMGIETSEEEMAALCLTREGTTWLGIYHGLSVRLRGSGFRTEFFECDQEELGEVTAEFPALLCCELTDEVDAAVPKYREFDGWIPGIAHSTVLFARSGDRYLIGDPSQSEPEIWTDDDIANLWTGRGLRIVRAAP
jgi:hypothetical protein